MAQKDYYSILGVSESASQDDIKKTYKKLAIKYHPDKNLQNKEKAESRFKEISEAYYVLGNPKKRQEYDTMRKFGYAGPGAGNAGFRSSTGFNFEELLRQFSSSGTRSRRSNMSGDYSIFEDILGDMFGMKSRTSSRQRMSSQSCGGTRKAPFQAQTVHSDIEQNVRLSSEQARAGGKIKLKLSDGEVLIVNIPKNVKTGKKLKIPNRGSVCPCCNKKGDLLLVLRIA